MNRMMNTRETQVSHFARAAPGRYFRGWRARYVAKSLSWNHDVKYAETRRMMNRAWGFSKKSNPRKRAVSSAGALELYAPLYRRISPAGVRSRFARPDRMSKSWRLRVPTR